MKKVVSVEQMRQLDGGTIQFGIDGILLMENAALGVTKAICAHVPVEGARAAVVCGGGNNGGDGFAVARHLANRGADVSICLLYDADRLKGDAKKNFEISSRMGIPIKNQEDFCNCDFIVDAIFGIGFRGSVQGKAVEIIEQMNRSGKKIFSIDIPSGVDGNTGAVEGSAVRAYMTITCGYEKTGLVQYPGREYAGLLEVCNISVPQCVEKQVPVNTYLGDDSLLKAIPTAAPDANKGSLGRVFVVAGSRGMTGAAALCCQGALRSGAGLVTLAVPEDLNAIMEVKLTEAMTVPVSCSGHFTKDALEPMLDTIQSSGALVLGPGIGKDPQTKEAVELLLRTIKIPIILDADGINIVAENINILDAVQGQVILTPHPGEFSRLSKKTIAQIQKNRLEEARDFAVKWGVTLVLKGAGTVTAAPDGTAWINTSGNPGMATGGSGDTLSGIIGAFAARGMEAPYAAAAGVYVHGKAADITAQSIGQNGLLPSDFTKGIAYVLK